MWYHTYIHICFWLYISDRIQDQRHVCILMWTFMVHVALYAWEPFLNKYLRSVSNKTKEHLFRPLTCTLWSLNSQNCCQNTCPNVLNPIKHSINQVACHNYPKQEGNYFEKSLHSILGHFRDWTDHAHMATFSYLEGFNRLASCVIWS